MTLITYFPVRNLVYHVLPKVQRKLTAYYAIALMFHLRRGELIVLGDNLVQCHWFISNAVNLLNLLVYYGNKTIERPDKASSNLSPNYTLDETLYT